MTALISPAASIETETDSSICCPSEDDGKIQPYRLGRDVTFLIQDDVARLLDLDRGRFYALNASGSCLLDLALRNGPDEAVRRVAQRHAVKEDIVRADWDEMLERLSRAGLVIPKGQCGRFNPPGRLGLWLLLTLAWLSLRTLGWARTVRVWRLGRTAAVEPWHDEWLPSVQKLDRAVRVAAGRHLLNTQCKERAVVAWYLLRNRWGLPAELVIGVLAFPFQAHAWVECGPLTVTDESIRCEMFTTAARYQ